MTLRFALEPSNGSQLVRDALSRLMARTSAHSPAPQTLSRVAPSSLQVMAPHAIYDLRADEIARGGGLETARATGFRYPIQAASRPVAAAEVHVDTSGQAHLVANINYGPFVEESERAFAALASSPQVVGQTYEARVLRCAAIPVLAIWLKGDPERPDWVYPLPPAAPTITTGVLCTVQDFLQQIRPIARNRAASHRSSVP